MPSSFSPQDAATALAEADRARLAMRHAVRAHRGHVHLWIWGAVWGAMALLAHVRGDGATVHFPWLAAVGIVASLATGFVQRRQVRMPLNARLLLALASVVAFAAVYPFVLHARIDARNAFVFIALIVAQCYVVAGLWTDTYLLWTGLLLTALLLIGLFCITAGFWLWIAVFAGGTLLATGFYVRYFWA